MEHLIRSGNRTMNAANLSVTKPAYIVNTDKKHDPDGYKLMLRKRAAYVCGKHVDRLNIVKKGDQIFLYHKGVGICAVGYAKGEAEDAGKHLDDKPSRRVKLDGFVSEDPEFRGHRCLSFVDMCEILEIRLPYREPRVKISEEKARKLARAFDLVRSGKKLHRTYSKRRRSG